MVGLYHNGKGNGPGHRVQEDTMSKKTPSEILENVEARAVTGTIVVHYPGREVLQRATRKIRGRKVAVFTRRGEVRLYEVTASDGTIRPFTDRDAALAALTD